MFEQNITKNVSLGDKLDFYENSFLLGRINVETFLSRVSKVVKEDLVD